MAVNDSTNHEADQGLVNGDASVHSSEMNQVESAPDQPDGDTQQVLFVSGLMYPVDGDKAGVEIRRGMTILTTEGEVAGVVAGVIHNNAPRKVEYILLSRPSQNIEYRMIPIDLVQQVDKERVLLHILAPLVSSLPPWRKDGTTEAEHP